MVNIPPLSGFLTGMSSGQDTGFESAHVTGKMPGMAHETNPILARIDARLEKIGESRESASLAIGASSDLLRNLSRNPKRTMRGPNLEAMARYLGVTPGWLLGRPGEPEPLDVVREDRLVDQPAPDAQAVFVRRDLPVRGTAAGAVIGSFQIDDVIDWVYRPPRLRHSQEAYALYVVGESMAPRFNQGDLIYAHPERPPAKGDIVVVLTETYAGGDRHALLKEYVSDDGERLLLRQYNPIAEVKVPRATVRAVHRVLPSSEILG